MTNIKDIVERVILQVVELPGRSSPEDQPEMMLVTDAELREILSDVFETAIKDERERCAKVIENGSFLHDQSPAARFAKEAAAAIRRGT